MKTCLKTIVLLVAIFIVVGLALSQWYDVLIGMLFEGNVIPYVIFMILIWAVVIYLFRRNRRLYGPRNTPRREEIDE